MEMAVTEAMAELLTTPLTTQGMAGMAELLAKTEVMAETAETAEARQTGQGGKEVMEDTVTSTEDTAAMESVVILVLFQVGEEVTAG